MKRTAPIPESPHFLAAAGLALAAYSALVICREFASPFVFPKFLALCAGVWLASLGAILSKDLAAGRSELDAPLLACAMALILSAVRSQDRLLSVLGDSYAYGLWPLALVGAVAWMAARLATGRQTALLRLGLVAYGLIGVYAALQAAGLEPFSGMPPPPDHRSYSTLGSPVFLGECMALMMPVGLFWALEGRERVLGWCCLAAVTAGLLTSISRGAWLGAAAGCGAYLAGRNTEFLKNHRRALLALAAAALLCGAFVWRSGRRSTTPGDSGRILIWRVAWDVFRERPLLGWGPDTFRVTVRPRKTPEMVRDSSLLMTPTHAHNDFFQALATTGIVGFAAYAALLFFIGRAAVRSWRSPEKIWRQAMASGLLGLFVSMKFNPAPVEVLACAAFFAGLLAAATGTVADPAARPARWPFYLLLAAASVSMAVVLRLGMAERADKEATRAIAAHRYELAQGHYEEAIRLNPWHADYRGALINLLTVRSFTVASPALRNAFLEAAEKVAREGVAIDPQDSTAHYFFGIALLNLASAGVPGKLDAAVSALDAALALDPEFAPSLQGRRDAARLSGDAARAAAMTAHIAALRPREIPTTFRVNDRTATLVATGTPTAMRRSAGPSGSGRAPSN